MATKDEIKKAVQKATGNPEAGPVHAVIDSIVEAIVGLDSEPAEQKSEERPAKETRVQKAPEIR